MPRRLRGIFGVATIWSLVFVLLPSPLSVWLYSITPAEYHAEVVSLLTRVTTNWAITGFLSGASFSSIIIWLARGSSVSAFSMRRFVAWGTTAGILAPVIVVPFLAVVGLGPAKVMLLLAYSAVGAVLGSATSGAMLWAARRSANNAQLSAGSHPADSALLRTAPLDADASRA